jgi:hypothetical protein
MVCYCGYMAYFKLDEYFKNNCISRMAAYLKSIAVLLMLVLAVLASAIWNFEVPAGEKAKAKFYGTPITSEVQSLEGKVFNPQAFVVTEHRVLVYDKDDKVYALDGIKLDDITPEQLIVASNVTYAVYQKGGQMFFGKL